MAEGKKVNPLLIVTIILGFLVIVLGTSTTILLLNKNNNGNNNNNNNNSNNNHSGDISGDLTVKLANKIDKSKSYIFDSEGKVGDYKVNNYPIININTTSVKTVNQDIEKSYLEKIENYHNYAYFYVIYNKYLSVVCYYKDGEVPVVDNAFVIDLSSGLVFTDTELLEVFGYMEEDIPEKANEKAFSEFDKDLNNLVHKYPRMSEEEQNELLLKTSDTINGRYYFVDGTGRLHQIYTCASYDEMLGPTGYLKTINMSNYSLAIYEIE